MGWKREAPYPASRVMREHRDSPHLHSGRRDAGASSFGLLLSGDLQRN